MIKQLAVFVENRQGSLMNVTEILSEGHINIRAVSSSDTPDFAILRLVVDRPEEARRILAEQGYVVRIQEVIGVELEDKKGNLNQMLKVLAQGKVSVNYIYSFVLRAGANPVMILSTDDREKAEEILNRSGINMVDGLEE